MFTGDIERSADAVASQRGINKVIAQVLPKQKEKQSLNFKIKKKNSGNGRRWDRLCTYISKADLGIATVSGLDVARETGEILLIIDERDIVTSLNLGRKT